MRMARLDKSPDLDQPPVRAARRFSRRTRRALARPDHGCRSRGHPLEVSTVPSTCTFMHPRGDRGRPEDTAAMLTVRGAGYVFARQVATRRRILWHEVATCASAHGRGRAAAVRRRCRLVFQRHLEQERARRGSGERPHVARPGPAEPSCAEALADEQPLLARLVAAAVWRLRWTTRTGQRIVATDLFLRRCGGGRARRFRRLTDRTHRQDSVRLRMRAPAVLVDPEGRAGAPPGKRAVSGVAAGLPDDSRRSRRPDAARPGRGGVPRWRRSAALWRAPIRWWPALVAHAPAGGAEGQRRGLLVSGQPDHRVEEHRDDEVAVAAGLNHAGGASIAGE